MHTRVRITAHICSCPGDHLLCLLLQLGTYPSLQVANPQHFQSLLADRRRVNLNVRGSPRSTPACPLFFLVWPHLVRVTLLLLLSFPTSDVSDATRPTHTTALPQEVCAFVCPSVGSWLSHQTPSEPMQEKCEAVTLKPDSSQADEPQTVSDLPNGNPQLMMVPSNLVSMVSELLASNSARGADLKSDLAPVNTTAPQPQVLLLSGHTLHYFGPSMFSSLLVCVHVCLLCVPFVFRCLSLSSSPSYLPTAEKCGLLQSAMLLPLMSCKWDERPDSQSCSVDLFCTTLLVVLRTFWPAALLHHNTSSNRP